MKKQKSTVNYASTTNQINTYWIHKFILVAIESLLYLTPTHVKVNLCAPWNTNCFKKYMHNCIICLFVCLFVFFISIIITKSLSACQVAFTVCFRNWKILYTSHEFYWRTFEFGWLTCSKVLQAKSRSFKWEDILKTNQQNIKNITQQGVEQLSMTSNSTVIKVFLDQFCCF